MEQTETLSEQLGVALKQVMLEQHMGQDELAKAVDVSRRTMNRILNGDVTVTYDRLTRIATALHTRLSNIIQRAEALADREVRDEHDDR
ncbi:helix-turn-helix domain-containing protein [Bifidobacterium pseudolongum]|nr:helix-turn-helix transcriptional regulator [Bifidobacterium pseudolongum]